MRLRIRKVEVLRVLDRSPYWYVRWYELKSDGKTWCERWQSSKSSRKADAEKLRRKIERELDAGKRIDADAPWQDVQQEFLEKHAAHKRPATYCGYDKSFKIFERTAKPKTIGQVTVGMLEDFRTARLKQPVAAETVNRDLRHVRALLKWAARREYIPKAPDFKGLFLRTDKKQPTIVPEADFLAMIHSLATLDDNRTIRPRSWWKAWLYVDYCTGLRLSEMMGLEWRDVRLDDPASVRVRAETSKGRKDRIVPIESDLAELLRAWRGQQPTLKLAGIDRVFPWPDNLPTYRQFYDDWYAIQKAAEIPNEQRYRPHDFRRTFCSELIRQGVPTATVKDLAGHETILTTERYYIDTTPAQRSAIARRKIAMLQNVG